MVFGVHVSNYQTSGVFFFPKIDVGNPYGKAGAPIVFGSLKKSTLWVRETPGEACHRGVRFVYPRSGHGLKKVSQILSASKTIHPQNGVASPEFARICL